MTDYIHRMTLVVPEKYIDIANHLALVAGEFPADIHTFTTATWKDVKGNKYAVCSTVTKPVVFALFEAKIAQLELVDFKEELVDKAKAQEALDKIVKYTGSEEVSTETILCMVDYDPLPTLEALGLSVVELNEADFLGE